MEKLLNSPMGSLSFFSKTGGDKFASSSKPRKKFASTELRMKLKKIDDVIGEAYIFWCPGCHMSHTVPVAYKEGFAEHRGKKKPVWRFNGDEGYPTFSPEIRTSWMYGTKHTDVQHCHVIIRDGELIYLVGSTHELSGKRFPMRHI